MNINITYNIATYYVRLSNHNISTYHYIDQQKKFQLFEKQLFLLLLIIKLIKHIFIF